MSLGWYHVFYTLEGGFLGGFTYMAAGELEIVLRSGSGTNGSPNGTIHESNEQQISPIRTRADQPTESTDHVYRYPRRLRTLA